MTWKTLLTRCWNSPPTLFSIASSFTIISFTFFCKCSTFAWTINKKNLNRIFKALQNTLSHNYPIYIPAFDVIKEFHFYWVRCIFINKMQNFVLLIACCPVSISFLRNRQRESEGWSKDEFPLWFSRMPAKYQEAKLFIWTHHAKT